MTRLILFLVVILAGCTNLPEYKWYNYHLAVTTGLAQSIESDGKRVAIKLAEMSDNKHLFSFKRLNQKIAISGNEIKVYGKLLAKIYHTPSGKTQTEQGELLIYPKSEAFQYFELVNWSIRSPIKLSRHHYDENDNLEIIIDNRPELTKDDFVSPINTDPKIYVVQ